MATEAITKPSKTLPPGEDPFRLGWRYVAKLRADGTKEWEQVGLTEWDLLHPMEEDFIVQNPYHTRDCSYLKGVFDQVVAKLADTIVFLDMRIDWQLDEDSILGPDISVFDNVDASIPWPPHKGTYPVKDKGARSVVMIEVTSPSTRDKDVGVKVGLYERMGIPLYILVDQGDDEEQIRINVYGYRMTPHGFERIPDDPRGIWIEKLRIWVRSAGDHVVCVDELGNSFPDWQELIQERDLLQLETNKEKQRAEQQKKRAEQEKQRAEQEKKRAESAEHRADENARKLAELEAELRRLRGDSN